MVGIWEQRRPLVLEDGDAESAAQILRSVIEAVPDALIMIDAKGRILSFSAAAEKMFGYPAEDVLGENVSVLMPSPDRERHDGYLARYLATGEAHVIGIGRLTTARRRDGATFPMELSVSRTELQGRCVFIGFVRDLSEGAPGHRRLQDLQAESAEGQRLSQLGGLASAIAHELNQPLSAATNYAEVAQVCLEGQTPNVEAALGAVRFCAEEMERSGRIVQQLRGFFARGQTSKSRVPLSKLISEASSIALAEARSRHSALWIEPCDERLDALADRIQVQQVIVNLVRNALEASGGASGLIVRLRAEALADDMIKITVEDAGPGVDKEVVEHLFHPLRTSKPNGMGLGLSICQQIVFGHGGEIWLERSELGGAAFHFTLPRFPSEEDLAA